MRPPSPSNPIDYRAAYLNVPIGCGGGAVIPGDIVAGDNERVVILPAHPAADMTQFETCVAERAEGDASIEGLYPPSAPATRPAFEARKANHQSSARNCGTGRMAESRAVR
ncbi:hypothetical protein LCL97_01155 [Seohaeicola saemankumensis]|nr:hypothetical protein [Seohaeicola saemankumensis]MCA0869419.1 hypothetical protein [Seohaeicola saemankumensis]